MKTMMRHRTSSGREWIVAEGRRASADIVEASRARGESFSEGDSGGSLEGVARGAEPERKSQPEPERGLGVETCFKFHGGNRHDAAVDPTETSTCAEFGLVRCNLGETSFRVATFVRLISSEVEVEGEGGGGRAVR